MGPSLRFSPVMGLVLLFALAVQRPSLAADRAYDSAESTRPLAVGDVVPSVAVEGISGERVDLLGSVRDQNALLVFYRGGW